MPIHAVTDWVPCQQSHPLGPVYIHYVSLSVALLIGYQQLAAKPDPGLAGDSLLMLNHSNGPGLSYLSV